MGNCGSVEEELESKLVEICGGHLDSINSIDVSADNSIIVTAGEDQDARLWATNLPVMTSSIFSFSDSEIRSAPEAFGALPSFDCHLLWFHVTVLQCTDSDSDSALQ